MLGSFHAAKCIEHCIGKYITGTGVMALKSVLEGTNYARSLKAILILTHAIDSLNWELSSGKQICLNMDNFYMI